MAGTPLKRQFPKGRCGALNRKGERCGIRLEVYPRKNGAWHCKFHGGKSTGSKTPEGNAKSARNLQAWRKHRMEGAPEAGGRTR